MKFLKKYPAGFTLFEILLTISIVAIICAMSSPCFFSCYHKIKTVALTQELRSELFLARSLAIQKGRKMFYCADDGDSWHQKRFIRDEAGIILNVFDSLPKGYFLQFQNSLGKNQKLSFNALGFTESERGSFYLLSPQEKVRIVVTISGRVRVEELVQ